jgi:hypothetical protein
MLSDLLALIPYRTGRRALGVDSSEEYELMILRLAGGEGGFMSAEPEAVGQRFATEAVSVNPELGVLREFHDARLMFVPGPLMRVLAGSTGDEAYAPPVPTPMRPAGLARPRPSRPSPPSPASPPSPSSDAALPFDDVRSPGASDGDLLSEMIDPLGRSTEETTAKQRCAYCGGGLPEGRHVNFCPQCGQPQATGQCPKCKADVEYGWKHCIGCGAGLNWGPS